MIHPSRPRSKDTRRLAAGFACASVLALGSCDQHASIAPEGPPPATGGAAGAGARPGPVRERVVGDRLVATPSAWVPVPEGGGAAGKAGTGGGSPTDAGADAPPRPLGDTCPEGLPGAKLVRVPAE
ncbi:MAG: hypothetical protein IT376_17745, partial [Polyangiaceae bacterium]|nr:hypothetical protein [Polyangiaceae bacterium]